MIQREPKYAWQFEYGLPVFLCDPAPELGYYTAARAVAGLEIHVVKWMPVNWVTMPIIFLIEVSKIVFDATFKRKR